MNKKVLLASVVLGAATLAGIGLATSTSADIGSSIDSKKAMFAEKLGVKESQVETAMQELKAEKMAAMKDKQEESLQKAVDDGVITAEQKDALITKKEEMRQKREAEKTEMEAWLLEQGIDREVLKKYQIQGKEGGFGKKMHKGTHKGMK